MLLRDDRVTLRHRHHEVVDKGDVQLPPIKLEMLDVSIERDLDSHNASLTDFVTAMDFHTDFVTAMDFH